MVVAWRPLSFLFKEITVDKWQCEECDMREPCILLMPTDYELTATVCPYSGTDCNWIQVEGEGKARF